MVVLLLLVRTDRVLRTVRHVTDARFGRIPPLAPPGNQAIEEFSAKWCLLS